MRKHALHDDNEANLSFLLCMIVGESMRTIQSKVKLTGKFLFYLKVPYGGRSFKLDVGIIIHPDVLRTELTFDPIQLYWSPIRGLVMKLRLGLVNWR